MKRQQQRGAAILLAMLSVVLVATLAAGMLWQQWRTLEVEAAQRARVQVAWILVGALDWARLILREDARQGGADHLSEPWAVPLAPARLSSFLAAERGQALITDDQGDAQDAFLSGQIEDLQGRLNVRNLVDGQALDAASVATWTRLFKQLKLPERELQALLLGVLPAFAPAGPERKTDARALTPGRVGELVWLGLTPATLQTLQAFITLLPERTVLNLNTAAGEVMVAAVPGLEMAAAEQLMTARARTHFGSLIDAQRVLNRPDLEFDASQHGVASRFFQVTGALRLGSTQVQEQSLLQRDGLQVRVLSRQRQSPSGPLGPLQ